MTQSFWTDAEKDKLTTLWDAGRSGSEISRAFGYKYSRMAVLGMARRLKLSYRSPQMNRHGPGVFERTARPPKPPPEPEPLLPEIEFLLPDGSRVTLETIEPSMCHWQVAGSGLDAVYCGHQVKRRSSYCHFHDGRVHEKQKPHQKQKRVRGASDYHFDGR